LTGSSKHHVVHLIGSTGLYGAERWILALLCGNRSGRTVATLVNLKDEKDGASDVVAAARQRGLVAVDFYTGGSFNPALIVRLARWLRRQKVDIVHGHGFKSDIVGLLSARLAGCKVMTTPHGWSFEADRKLQVYEKLDRFSFRFMDRVCPLSSDLEDGVRGLVPPEKLRMILNGVDVEEVRSVSAQGRRAEGKWTIGYVGQLIERKDLGTLLEAVGQVSADRPEVALKIVGDGARRPWLEAQAASCGLNGCVEFLGFRADALGLMKSFDLFVLPSLLEGIPRCIMEAMAAGVPVAVSDIPGNRNLVVPGETGLLFRPGDATALAEVIRFMMDHPAETRMMAERGVRLIDDDYSNRRMAKEYENLYMEMLGR